ncbi:MAG: hypothetical protein A3D10_03330 [Omnitrophica WOR_2 bacterium RIFCSPHIGHO2_02_FULL_48_11]|nr:MAG: hypothetical protein A3D10_03330 [Omnitrophica WOR_2 bacterium RIFCSPHIGHO2_02_FULL_48_11]
MKKDLLRNFSGALLVVFLFIFFYCPLETEDIWWHLNAGRWIVQHHAVPHVDIFPFAERADPWILTQWLGSVIFYLTQDIAGYQGLQLLRACVFLLALGMFFMYARRKMPLAWLFLLIFIMAFGLGTRCLLRPFIFNFIFIQLFLIILFRHQTYGKWTELLWLPLAVLVWGNLHAGSFIYGLSLPALFLLSEVIRYYVSSAARGEVLSKIKNLLLVCGLSAGALFINPYGMTGALFPAKAVFVPGFIDFYGMGHMTAEMRPPIEILSFRGAWFFLLLIPAVGVLGMPRNKSLTHVMLFLTALFSFLYASRAADFFVIVAAYIIVEGLQKLSLAERWRVWPENKKVDRLIYGVMTFLLVINIVHTVQQKVVLSNQAVRKIFLQEDADNPAAAARFLNANGITGRVFNSYEYGGYIGWTSYPRLRPFVDGRQANQCDAKVYLKILADPAQFWPAAEAQYRFDIVLFNANEAFHYRYMDYLITRSDWQLVFVKGPVVVFVKRGKFVLVEKVAKFEERLKTAQVDLETISLPDLSRENIFVAALKDFFDPLPEYVDQRETGAVLYAFGYKAAGIRTFWESIQDWDGRTARYVLSLMVKDYRGER